MTRFCPDCGAPVVGNNKFCKNCGCDVSHLIEPIPINPNAAQVQQNFAAQNPNVAPAQQNFAGQNPNAVQNPYMAQMAQKDYTIWIIVGIILSVIIALIGPIVGMIIGAYVYSKKQFNPKNETYGIIVMSVGLIIFVIEILFIILVLMY